jgi:hypothetical protein
VDRAARSLIASTKVVEPEPPMRRVLAIAVSACDDPTQHYCCSGACVPQGTTCPAINPNSYTEVWCQAIVDSTNDVNNFDMWAFIGSIIDCVNGYSDNPDTDPFGPDADTSQVVSYCWPMRGSQSWGWSGISLDLKGWINERCGGPGFAAMQCSCPMYQCVGRSDSLTPGRSDVFNYQQTWFTGVAVSEEAKIVNFFVVLQLMISALTGQEGPLSFIGAFWYSFWIIFPVPVWWQYMFLMRKDFTNWGQEEMCAVLHFGSFWEIVLMLIGIKILFEVFWPLAIDIVDMLPMPARFKSKRKIRDDEKPSAYKQ